MAIYEVITRKVIETDAAISEVIEALNQEADPYCEIELQYMGDDGIKRYPRAVILESEVPEDGWKILEM